MLLLAVLEVFMCNIRVQLCFHIISTTAAYTVELALIQVIGLPNTIQL